MEQRTEYRSNLSFGHIRHNTLELYGSIINHLKNAKAIRVFEYNCADAPHILYGAHLNGISIHIQAERNRVLQHMTPIYGHIDITLISHVTPTSELEESIKQLSEKFKIRTPHKIQVW